MIISRAASPSSTAKPSQGRCCWAELGGHKQPCKGRCCLLSLWQPHGKGSPSSTGAPSALNAFWAPLTTLCPLPLFLFLSF